MNINAYPHDWQEAWGLQIATLCQQFPHAHLYALIDGVLDESCYPFIKRADRLPYFALYANTPSADEETFGLSPLLVEYDAKEQHTWDTLLQKTNGLPALSLIVTPESLAQLAERLTPWSIVNAADQFLALSFSDTRILPQLFQVLTTQQLEEFCGPTLRWQYVTREARWCALPLPKATLPPAEKVELDEQQCTRLIDAAEADGVLFQLRKGSANLVDCHTPARAHEMVSHWLACANHAQMDSVPDRVRLCKFGFMHPALEKSPQLAAWLRMPSRVHTLEALEAQWTTSDGA